MEGNTSNINFAALFKTYKIVRISYTYVFYATSQFGGGAYRFGLVYLSRSPAMSLSVRRLTKQKNVGVLGFYRDTFLNLSKSAYSHVSELFKNKFILKYYLFIAN
jgi:hypothetical protein